MNGRESASVLRLVWAAFLSSLALYTAVVFLLAGSPGAPSDLLSILRPALAFVAVGLALASVLVRRSVLRRRKSVVSSGLPADSSSMGAERVRVSCIVTWALSETIAVLGLVLSVLSRDSADFLPFVAAAGFLLYWHRPAVWQVA